MSLQCRRRCDPHLFIDSVLPFNSLSPSPSSLLSSSSFRYHVVLIGRMIRESRTWNSNFSIELAFYCGHVRHFRTCATQINNTIEIVYSIQSRCARALNRANSPKQFCKFIFISSLLDLVLLLLAIIVALPSLIPDAQAHCSRQYLHFLSGHRERLSMESLIFFCCRTSSENVAEHCLCLSFRFIFYVWFDRVGLVSPWWLR